MARGECAGRVSKRDGDGDSVAALTDEPRGLTRIIEIGRVKHLSWGTNIRFLRSVSASVSGEPHTGNEVDVDLGSAACWKHYAHAPIGLAHYPAQGDLSSSV